MTCTISQAQHSSIKSSSEQYSFLLITLNPVLSLSARLTTGDEGDLPAKSPWIFGQKPWESSLSTRVSWKVGTRYGSTEISATASQLPSCSTQRSTRAPRRPQGSLTDRCTSSWPMCSRSFSGISSLEQCKTPSLASVRLSAMSCTTSLHNATSVGSKNKSDSDRSARDMEPAGDECKHALDSRT